MRYQFNPSIFTQSRRLAICQTVSWLSFRGKFSYIIENWQNCFTNIFNVEFEARFGVQNNLNKCNRYANELDLLLGLFSKLTYTGDLWG